MPSTCLLIILLVSLVSHHYSRLGVGEVPGDVDDYEREVLEASEGDALEELDVEEEHLGEVRGAAASGAGDALAAGAPEAAVEAPGDAGVASAGPALEGAAPVAEAAAPAAALTTAERRQRFMEMALRVIADLRSQPTFALTDLAAIVDTALDRLSQAGHGLRGSGAYAVYSRRRSANGGYVDQALTVLRYGSPTTTTQIRG